MSTLRRLSLFINGICLALIVLRVLQYTYRKPIRLWKNLISIQIIYVVHMSEISGETLLRHA